MAGNGGATIRLRGVKNAFACEADVCVGPHAQGGMVAASGFLAIAAGTQHCCFWWARQNQFCLPACTFCAYVFCVHTHSLAQFWGLINSRSCEKVQIEMKIFDLPLETDRLILRRARHDDFSALFPIHSDPDVCRYLPYEPRDEAGMKEALDKRVALTELVPGGDALFLAVELKATGEVIGEVLLFYRHEEWRQGEVGYMFSPKFHGKGYAYEATRAFMDAAFDHFNLHRISARCSAANTASWRLMERLNMRREADFREHEMFKGEWDHLYIYAILEDEWRGQRS